MRYQNQGHSHVSRRTAGLFGLVVIAMLVLAACAPASQSGNTNQVPLTGSTPTTAAPAAVPTTAPTMAATMAPTVAASATSAPAANGSGNDTGYGNSNSGAAAPTTPSVVYLKVQDDAKLGKFLVDEQGKSLYLFTKDTPDKSNCEGKCLAAWPALLVAKGGSAQVTGGDSSLIGTTTRSDGSTQVTYNHWPLYYFAKDTKPGDTTGQGVGSVWFLVTPDGKGVGMESNGSSSSGGNSGAAASTGSAPAEVHLKTSNTADLGNFLVDDKGMTLYLYTKDTPGVSNCEGKCLAAWPALLVAKDGKVSVDGGDASLLGTITRSDGSTQVTYRNLPLYYFAKDTKAGDTTGQGVGSVWFVVKP